MVFLRAGLNVFLRLLGWGVMAMTEVEKSIMERTFYTKLGPTPAYPPRPPDTGQVKPAPR